MIEHRTFFILEFFIQISLKLRAYIHVEDSTNSIYVHSNYMYLGPIEIAFDYDTIYGLSLIKKIDSFNIYMNMYRYWLLHM